MNKVYTAQEVADKLKIKKSTVYDLIKRGELSSSKVGKQLRVSEEQLIVCSIITVIGAFKLFTEVYSTTVGGPGNASQVLGLFLYQNAFLHDDMGMAAATGVLIFVITVTASIFQLKVSRSGEI